MSTVSKSCDGEDQVKGCATISAPIALETVCVLMRILPVELIAKEHTVIYIAVKKAHIILEVSDPGKRLNAPCCGAGNTKSPYLRKMSGLERQY